MRYLFLYESGTFVKSDLLLDEDLEDADSGLVDIIDTKKMVNYYLGKWHTIDYIKRY